MTEETYSPPKSVEELLARYAAGERSFKHVNLVGAELGGVNLRGADFSRATLVNANLSRANLTGAQFTRAGLMCTDFTGSDLSYAGLGAANVSRGCFSEADLIGANLTGADLGRANLQRALLMNAHLTGANLNGADLSRADLRSANFSGAHLGTAILDGTTLDATLLVDVDLSPFADANPPVLHFGSSSVDFRSIVRSLRTPKLKEFLQGTGMPEVFVEYNVSCAESLDGSIIKRMLQSTFISYGSPDESFARKLYEALHRNSVTTFFFAEHAVPGDKLHRLMRKGVNEHDRVILVCSKASLDRKGVLNEIEETLARESRDGGAAYLIPIRLDDYVFNGWAPPNADTAQAVRDRVVADFEGADSDPTKFDAGVRRLIAALKK